MVTSRSFSMSHMAPESPVGLGSPCCPLLLNSIPFSCIIPELLNWAPSYFLGCLFLHILLKRYYWKVNHLMASSSVLITFLWIPDKRSSQGRFLPTVVSEGFVSTMARKHGRSSSVDGSSRRWRLPHVSVNKQAGKDRSEPSKACPQWSTSAIQASPPSFYSLQNSATSWGLCAQDAILWGKFSVSNHDDWGTLITSVQICNKIQMSSLHLGLLCVT